MTYLAYDQSPLWPYFVRAKPDGLPYLTTDGLPSRMFDWPFPGFPYGQETCDNVLDPGREFALCGCEMFSPFDKYTVGGDGGDIVVVTELGARAVATQDGGRPGQLYYFEGPGVGLPANGTQGGWLLCGNSPENFWTLETAFIVQAFPGVRDIQGSPSPAATLYLVDTFSVPFMRNGRSIEPRMVQSLAVQHFTSASPNASTSMELFYYGKGLGKYGWAIFYSEPLPAGVSIGPALDVRWPQGMPYSTPPHGMVMTDCRFWTNEVPEPLNFVKHSLLIPSSFKVSSTGWPPADGNLPLP